MGVIKLIFYGAAGVVVTRSILGVRAVAKAIKVPTNSLLNQFGRGQMDKYADAYKVVLPKGTRVDLNQLVSAFYGCKVFANFEHHVLVCLARCPPPKLDSLRLSVGTRIYFWEVEALTKDEVLLTWSFTEGGPIAGTTWFHVPPGESSIVMGSSLLMPSPLNVRQGCVNTRDLSQIVRAGLYDIKDQKNPLMPRLWSGITKIVTAASAPAHDLYSRYLLVSTMKRLSNK